MATTIKAEAVRWFLPRFGNKSSAMFASKFYIPEKSWTRKSAWWFEIPRRRIESGESADIHLLCQTGPDTNDFHCLTISVAFFREELSKFFVRENAKISLFLSAEQHEMFIEMRGSERLSFERFLKPADLPR